MEDLSAATELVELFDGGLERGTIFSFNVDLWRPSP
jgi:hypothetical protein